MSAVRALAAALSFLTRLPVGRAAFEPRDLSRSLMFFPAAGLVLGLGLHGLAWLAEGSISPELAAVGLAAFLVALTGGLHVDGLADVVDGLAGARGDRARALAIMRDSRIGSLGAAALALHLVAKVVAIRDVLAAGETWALWLFPAAARWAAVPLVACFPCARPEGLGAAFRAHARPLHLVVATLWMAAAVLLSGRAVGAAAASGLALVTSLGLGAWLARRLGGLTGDTYGAAIEVAELGFLVSVAWLG